MAELLNPSTLKGELKKLATVLTIGFCVAFFILSIGVLRLHTTAQERLARAYALAARNSVITREYRNAIATLAPSIGVDFLQVTLQKGNGSKIFTLPPKGSAGTPGYHVLVTTTKQSIYSRRPARTGHLLASLTFSYSLIWPVLVCVIVSILLLSIFALVFYFMKMRIEERHSLLLRQMQLNIAGSMARQLAHDIRSPLSALNMVTAGFVNVSEEKRILMRSAVQRINDIANGLLQKGKELPYVGKETASEVLLSEPVMVSALIDRIISEKRLEYRNLPGLNLGARYQQSYGLFVLARQDELARVISNLINNSVEAINGTGSVLVDLGSDADSIFLEVRDDGEGIPSEILTKLGRKGFSFGKEGTGHGLGLNHAKSVVESCGGILSIQSEVNKGTVVKLKLPRVPPPNWFVESLRLEEGNLLVSVDDDQSIHMVWATRLASAGAGKNGIDHLSFSSISTFVDWAKQENLRNTLYLVDYEFLNQDMNGLEAIDQAGIAKNSILVTSRYEELKVREHAKRMGIKMIPKALAPLVPIVIEKSLLYDACLIDDDPLIHLTWETAAGSAGKSLRCFFSAEQFFSEASNIEKSTPLYVDVHLGNGIRGEEISRKILDLGFTQIFLATGYEPEKILTPSVQVKIVGKEPPF